MTEQAQTKAGRALIAVLTPTPLAIDDRLYASPEFLHEQVARIENEAANAERERLRQGVGELNRLIRGPDQPMPGVWVNLDDVHALLRNDDAP